MRFDLIFPTARNLWREQPRWRWVTIVAALSTIAALVSGAGSPGGSPGGGSPAPAPTSGGGAPTIVMPGPPANFEVDKRLRSFYQAYVDADANKAQEGLRCEKLTAAFAKLEADDERNAKPVQIAAIDEAKRCGPRIEESDQRIGVVAAELKRFRQASTLDAAGAVEAATTSLTDFDRSRDLGAKGVSPEELDKLKLAAQQYKRLLERMTTLAPLYRSRDPATLATAVELAQLRRDAAALPFAFDGAGLQAPQREALNSAAGADEALSVSDYKIGVLKEAFARRAADPIGMTIALGSLDPFDRARLDSTPSGLNLQEAESAARASVGQAISQIANDYVKAPTYANASMLVQLAALADELKADVPADAKSIVARARADLVGSEKRLKALNDVAARWREVRAQGARDPGVEARINRVFAAIVPNGSAEPNAFDAAALTPQDKASLGTVLAAVIEIQGRLLPGQRRAVTIAVRGPSSADARTAQFINAVAMELQRLGFAVTTGASQADTTFVLNLSAPALADGGVSSAGLYQRRASTVASMQWAYSGRTADLGTVTGVGADRDNRAITDAALQAAAAEVGKRVLAKVQGD